ncbi:MAG: leucine-rich repeat protein [Christensenellaceae bacterium]|jgi:hypothetical protein|nr:leucine-rich repeat protein [Christensenellaceae bacterium]
MRLSKTLTFIIVLLAAIVMLVSCGNTDDNSGNVYYIAFDANGGVGNFSPIRTTGNGTVVMPNPPSRDGYNFLGWYFERDYGDRELTATSLGRDPIFRNTTVYARWSIIEKTPEIVVPETPQPTLTFRLFLVSDAHSKHLINVYTSSVTENELSNIFSKQNYILSAWYKTNDFSGIPVQFPFDNDGEETDVTLYAKWDKITFPVVFSLDAPDAQGDPPAIEYHSIDEEFSLPENTARRGEYVFSGWLNGENLAGAVYRPGDVFSFSATPIGNKIEFIAKWDRTYAATFVTDDEFSGSLPDNIRAVAGHSYSLPAVDDVNFVRYGYKLVAWEDPRTEKYFPTKANEVILIMPQNGIEFKAVWSQLFTVEFASNGATGIIYGMEYAEGDVFSLPDNTGLVYPEHAFEYWYLDDGEADDKYFANESYEMIARNIIFKAKWSEIPQFTVSFLPNGGLPSEAVPKVSAKRAGELFTVPASQAGFSRQHYAFRLWLLTYTLDSETHREEVYSGAIISMPATNVEFSAVWSVIYYDINYDFGISLATVVVNPNPTQYTIEDGEEDQEGNRLLTINKISAVGYHFNGWYKTASRDDRDKYGDETCTISTVSPQIITLYAKFTLIDYKVYLSDGETTNDEYIDEKSVSVNSNIETDSTGKYFIIRFGEIINNSLSQVSVHRPGYVLAYWANEAGEVSQYNTAVAPWSNPSDIKLTAVWTEPGDENLIYIRSDDGTYMRVRGYLGNAETIIIPSYYQRLPVARIDIDAFRDSVSKHVFIPSTIKSIASNAFYNSAIVEIELGAGVITIEDNAFRNVTNLKFVKAENSISLQSIGVNAFTGSSILEYVVLPATVLSIGTNAFSNISDEAVIYSTAMGPTQGYANGWNAGHTVVWNIRTDKGTGLVYTILDNISHIVGYIGTDSSITIPATLGGCAVSTIRSGAFANNKFIQSVEISNTLTSINAGSFENCSELYAVIFNKGVADISSKAFKNTHSAVLYFMNSYPSYFFTDLPFYSSIANRSDLVFDDDTMSYYLKNGTSYILTKYVGGDNEITLTQSFKGSTISKIGDRAFSGSSISSVRTSVDLVMGRELFYTATSPVDVYIVDPINVSLWSEKWNVTLSDVAVEIKFSNEDGWIATLSDNFFGMKYYRKEIGLTSNVIYIIENDTTSTEMELEVNPDMSLSGMSNVTVKGIIGAFNNENLNYINIDGDIGILNSFYGNSKLVFATNNVNTYNRLNSIFDNVYNSLVTKTLVDDVTYYVAGSELIRVTMSSPQKTTMTIKNSVPFNKIKKGAFISDRLVRVEIDTSSSVSIELGAFGGNESLILYYGSNVTGNFTGINAYNMSDPYYGVSGGYRYYIDVVTDEIAIIDYTNTSTITLNIPEVIDSKYVTKIDKYAFTRMNIPAINLPLRTHSIASNAISNTMTVTAKSLYNLGWEYKGGFIINETLEILTTNWFRYFLVDGKAYIIDYNADVTTSTFTIPATLVTYPVAGIFNPFANSRSAGKINTLIINGNNIMLIGAFLSLASNARVLFSGAANQYQIFNAGLSNDRLIYNVTYNANYTNQGVTYAAYTVSGNPIIIVDVISSTSDFVELPSSATTIMNGAFSETNISVLTIPASYIDIEQNAFLGANTKMRIILNRELLESEGSRFDGYTLYVGADKTEYTPYSVDKNQLLYYVDDVSNTAYLIAYKGLVVEAQFAIPLTIQHNSKQYNVVGIGDYAFEGYIYEIDSVPIKEISIHNKISYIGKNAFIDADLEIELRLQETALTAWGTNWNCGLTYIEKFGAVSEGFRYFVIGSEAYLNEYVGLGGIVTVPATISSYNVVSIGSVFANKNNITEIIINAQITDFVQAIVGCVSLTKITLPRSVTYIPSNAFNGLFSLSEIIFPDTTISITIGDRAFANLILLTSITLPNILSIGEYALSNTNLTSFDLAKFPLGIIPQGTFAGCSKLVTLTNQNLVTKIGAYAFYKNTKLSSVDFSSATITSIGDYAFSECSLLTVAKLPSTLQEIAIGLFAKDEMLRRVVMPTTVKKIEKDAFKNAKNLASFEYDFSQLESIGASAFDGCSALVIKDLLETNTSLKQIGERAFFGVKYIGIFKINQNLEKIGIAAFANAGVIEFNVDVLNKYFTVVNNALYADQILLQFPLLARSSTALELSEVIIAPYAFYGVSNYIIEYVYIENVTAIGEYAFSNMQNTMIAVNYSTRPYGWSPNWTDQLNVVWLESPVAEIFDNYVYKLDSSSTSYEIVSYLGAGNIIEIPLIYKGLPVNKIASNAFKEKDLTFVTIDATIESIGVNAFAGNPGLTIWYKGVSTDEFELGWQSNAECYVGALALTLEDDIYYYQTNINKIAIVKVISKTLKYVDFDSLFTDKEVEIIKSFAIYGSEIIALNLPTSIVSIEENAFTGVDNVVIITSAVDALTGWNFIIDDQMTIHYASITIIDGDYIVGINENGDGIIYRFIGANSNGALTIPKILSTITIVAVGTYAFSGTNFTSIVAQSINILPYAFANMSNLESFKLILNEEQEIERYAFSNSSRLSNFVIVDLTDKQAFSMAVVKASAFDGCISLVYVITEPNATTSWSANWDRIKMQTSSTVVRVMVLEGV